LPLPLAVTGWLPVTILWRSDGKSILKWSKAIPGPGEDVSCR
jgi:hypothetical protein